MKKYLCPAISSLMFCAAVMAQPPVPLAESAADQTAKQSEAVAAKLVSAAGAGDIETLSKMLDHGVNINSRTSEGLTALLAARIRGQKEAYDFLAQKGADAQIPLPAPEVLVDALFKRSFSKDGAGAAVLVARDGKILFEKGYGLADIEHGIAVTPATKFRIGSITKQFTAASILRLQEAGKLKVSDPLSKYYPDFPRGGEVTLERMLNHTSGIHSYTERPGFYAGVTKPVAPAALVAEIEKYPFDFNPGEKWAYSNSNFFILGEIVAKVSGESYEAYLQQTLFAPLGMTATGIYHNDSPPVGAAVGYSFANGAFRRAIDWDMSWAGGAGSLYSTVEDLYRWYEGVFGQKVLNPESLAAALTPGVTEENKNDSRDSGYGYGLHITRFRGAREISHGGGLHGFLTNVLRLPDKKLTVVVLTNSFPQKPSSLPAALSYLIVEAYIGAELGSPPLPARTAVPASALAAIVGRYDYRQAILDVTQEGDHVYARLGGQPRFEIFPKSETEFFWKVVDAQVTFNKDASGKVVSATHHSNGGTIHAARLADVVEVKLDDASTEPLLGTYDVGAGDGTITREAGRLYLQVTGQPKFELGATSETEFFIRQIPGELTVVKDANGNVKSLILHRHGRTLEWPKAK